MKTVLLLGAGASVAEAEGQNRPKGEWPPLDATFLEYIHAHDGSNFRKLNDYSKDRFGLDLFQHRTSMEFLFNRIYYLASDHDEADRTDRKMYVGLIKLLRNAIARSVSTLQTTQAGPLNKLLRKLIRTTELSDLCVITFNYDILVEKILHSLSKTHINLNSSYCLKKVNIIPGISEKAKQFESTSNQAGIKILKLHGSLNWFREWGSEKKSIEKNGDSNDLVYLYPAIGDLEKFNKVSPDRKISIEMLPVIVPPIYEKTAFYKNVLKSVWQAAKEKLYEAQRLIIVGYSLPDADIKSQILLSSSIFHKNKQFDTIVINIDSSLCEHYSKRLPLKSLLYFKSVNDFLSKK